MLKFCILLRYGLHNSYKKLQNSHIVFQSETVKSKFTTLTVSSGGGGNF